MLNDPSVPKTVPIIDHSTVDYKCTFRKALEKKKSLETYGNKLILR